MLTNFLFVAWSWCRVGFVRRVCSAYSSTGTVPCFNARSHTGSNGRIVKLEPLTALHVHTNNIKLGEWDDLDKIGPKRNKHTAAFDQGWFNGYLPLSFKNIIKYGFPYLDGYFLRKTLK